MAIGDFFGLDEAKYANRMRRCSIEELREREVNKCREMFSSSFSIRGTLHTAIHTAGCSLIVGLICCRRASIAQQKLDIIRDELATRGQARHELQVEDCCIPFGVYTCGLCVGCGVHTCVGDVIAPVPAYVPTGESAIPAILEHPVQAIAGVTHAFQNQNAELIHAATVHSTSATQSYLQLPASIPSSSGGQAGYYTGMRFAPSADSTAADFVANKIGDSAVDKFEKKKYP